MENFLNKKVILWDFDGVILDSMSVRKRGFREVLWNYPKEEVDLLIKYHDENGGLSRYVKFAYFFDEILNIKIEEEILKKLLLNFSAIMRELLVDKNLLISNVISFIQNNSYNYRMHIVSGSDEKELKYLSEKLEISQYFKSIHGSPKSKDVLVRELLKFENYNSSQVCLVGDSINDYSAAQSNNIEFFGYNNVSLKAEGCNYINKFE